MTALETITTQLDAITPEQIARTALSLQPVQSDETVLTKVESPYILKLWTLAHEYARREQLAGHAARFDAANKEQREELIAQHALAHCYEEVIRGLAWIEVRTLLEVNKNVSLGLREDFTLVTIPDDEEDGAESIVGVINATGLLRAIGEFREKQKEEIKKTKPQ
jgi:hypothetical protein